MTQRLLGRTGMKVSPIGLGGGPLGDLTFEEAEAERLVRGAFDLGINVVDTAPGYGASEVRIGRVLASLSAAARDEIVVVTKGGYGVTGACDWTPEVIERGIEQALTRLSLDRIDVFLLHSCPHARLARGDLIAPLERAKTAGKVRTIGYSGDGDALSWAIACDAFDVVECSVNLVDQACLSSALPRAIERGKGVLGKRSMAGAPWTERGRDACYVDRWRIAFGTPLAEMPTDEIAIRFAAHTPGVGSALTGTRRMDRLRRAMECAARGPLPEAIVREAHLRFARYGESWPGVV